MDGIEIDSELTLRKWLLDKPTAWTQILATRAALRALPMSRRAEKDWFAQHALSTIRACAISWAALTAPHFEWVGASGNATTFVEETVKSASRMAVEARRVSRAGNMPGINRTASDWVAVNAAAESAKSAVYSILHPEDSAYFVANAATWAGLASPAFWLAISADCDFLSANIIDSSAQKSLLWKPLWLARSNRRSAIETSGFLSKLADLDSEFLPWVEWYERRNRGERSTFEIPGDRNHVEDTAILGRLAAASDEDFWAKGYKHVNAELASWLEEARTRAAVLSAEQETKPEDPTKIDVPPPVSGATAYGLNTEGKLDPLPNNAQQHLRDLPIQRQAYAEMREAAQELQGLGQRLGPKLLPKVDRFLDAAPERFENAVVALLWSAGTALRTLYWMHKAVADNPEPDEAKLDPAAAVMLRGLLDYYNVFAFGDDGLREKDENRIAPQERLLAQEQASLARPVEQAIIATEAIRTEVTLTIILENRTNIELAVGTPYADQALDQANKETQSQIAGLMTGARSVLANSEAIGSELAKLGVKGVATAAVGAASYAVYEYGVIEFIAVNAEPLKAYVMAVFESYPHLPELVDRVKLIWQRLRRKVKAS